MNDERAIDAGRSTVLLQADIMDKRIAIDAERIPVELTDSKQIKPP